MSDIMLIKKFMKSM